MRETLRCLPLSDSLLAFVASRRAHQLKTSQLTPSRWYMRSAWSSRKTHSAALSGHLPPSCTPRQVTCRLRLELPWRLSAVQRQERTLFIVVGAHPHQFQGGLGGPLGPGGQILQWSASEATKVPNSAWGGRVSTREHQHLGSRTSTKHCTGTWENQC